MGIKQLLLIPILATTGAVCAQSTFEAMSGYVGTTSSSYSPIYSVQAGPVGWTFQPLTDIEVTDLGAWAHATPGTGLEIGLWNAGGTLLASNTVTSGSQAVNQSLYVPINPVMLSAGQTYYLGAYSPAGSFQCIAVVPNSGPNGYATMSPDIQLGSAANQQNSGFVFPDISPNDPGSAIVAPNFEFQPVPEPASVGLSGVGALAWFAVRRRRLS
jgi:hypothetical protein